MTLQSSALAASVAAVVVAAYFCLAPAPTTHRVHNFSAGPGALPLSVVEAAQAELGDYHGAGMGLFEMSHRDVGGPVQSMISGAALSLRRMLAVPDTHEIFYMQAGAHGQFAAVPGNLGASADSPGCYVETGYWSRRAASEAINYVGDASSVRRLAGAQEDGSALLDPAQTWAQHTASCSYVHVCASETIDGLEFLSDDALPGTSDAPPLVADFTSTLLSRRVDVSRYGVIYASGGKNLGPAGFAVVIVRRSLIEDANRRMGALPSVLDWALHANSQPIHSIYNTPPTLALYFHSLVLEHLKRDVGDMDAVERRAVSRAASIYGVVDDLAGYYVSKVTEHAHRSRMNVPLSIGAGEQRRKDLEQLFVESAEKEGMFQLFGHPVTGGLRVTLYNGIADESVEKVAEFMRRFANEHPM